MAKWFITFSGVFCRLFTRVQLIRIIIVGMASLSLPTITLANDPTTSLFETALEGYDYTSGGTVQVVDPFSDHSYEDYSCDIISGGQAGAALGPNLTNSNFSYASLVGAILDHARLDGANFTGADLSDADLYGASLVDARLDGAILYRVLLEEGRLDGASLVGANVQRTTFEAASLVGATFDHAVIWRTDFLRADLRGASLIGANLYDSYLDGINLSDADLRGANLTGNMFEGANVRGAKLLGANLSHSRSLETSDGPAYYDSYTDFTGTGFDPVVAGWILVPEPTTFTLLLLGLLTLVRMRCRR